MGRVIIYGMSDTHETYSWNVRSYECGADGLATLPSICNYLQETASMHAESLSFSRTDFEHAGMHETWVLARLKVEMTRFPAWNEQFSILTYPRGIKRVSACRDFVVSDAKGEEIGKATSEWAIIDLKTRSLVPVPSSVAAAANDVRPPVFGETHSPRPKFGRDVPPTASFDFRALKSDIDLNGHVNNVRYIAWLLENAPVAHSLDIVFRSETTAGEELRAEAAPVDGGGLVHRIYSPSDGRERIVAATF